MSAIKLKISASDWTEAKGLEMSKRHDIYFVTSRNAWNFSKICNMKTPLKKSSFLQM